METVLEALAKFSGATPEEYEERPWGIYADWFRSDELTMKIMAVKPGQRMSLQSHNERQEIWHTVQGEGVDEGLDSAVPLLPGTTHHIPIGQIHRIHNTGDMPLVIIETQAGRCSEDDIVRYEDDYNRA